MTQEFCFQSAEGLAKMMALIVTVFEAEGLTVSEIKTKAMPLGTSNQAPQTSPLVIVAEGQRYKQRTLVSYLGRLVVASADNFREITRPIRFAWVNCNRAG